MATRSIVVRPGTPRDIATVDALMTAAFDPRYGEAWTRGQCLGVLSMPGVRLTIAEVDDQPAGFALVRTVLDEAELLLLAVAPSYRRAGIGTALMRGVVAAAEEAGVAAIHLEVRAGNEAIRLYAAHGFTQVGERRGYYRGRSGQLHDAHSYRRALKPL
jgi:ribosomal-protein-alanine N-acetyltransferase